MLLRVVVALGFGLSSLGTSTVSAEQEAEVSNHSLFVWAGDRDKKGNDFLLVIDADPRSPKFGRMVASVQTDQRDGRFHPLIRR